MLEVTRIYTPDHPYQRERRRQSWRVRWSGCPARLPASRSVATRPVSAQSTVRNRLTSASAQPPGCGSFSPGWASGPVSRYWTDHAPEAHPPSPAEAAADPAVAGRLHAKRCGGLSADRVYSLPGWLDLPGPFRLNRTPRTGWRRFLERAGLTEMGDRRGDDRTQRGAEGVRMTGWVGAGGSSGGRRGKVELIKLKGGFGSD